MENLDSNYETYVLCTNCPFRGKIKILKGYRPDQTTCPKCGNLTLKNDPNGEIFNRPRVVDDYK